MSIRRRSPALVAGPAAAAAAALIAAVGLALGAGPAAAVMDTPNPLGCAASASVQSGRARSQFVDGGDGEVRLPRQGDVYWTGSVAKAAHKESGEVRLVVGFWSVSLGSWGTSANPSNQVMRQGATTLPAFVRYIPPGRYRVEGEHEAAEGRCSGAVTVVLAGSTTTTVAALGGVLVAALLTIGLLRSGRRRPGRKRGRPIRGAVLGALLGAVVAAVLVSGYLVPSDSVVVGALPITLLVAGIVLGATAPLGRPKPAAADAGAAAAGG